MPEPERPPYAVGPGGLPSIDLIRWHISETRRLIDEWMEWMKENKQKISMTMKAPIDLGSFEFWDNSDDAEWDEILADDS